MNRELSRPLVLLAEDEVLIGLDLSDVFEASGYAIAGPFASCAEVASWLRDHTPDFAILDLNLRDGPCIAVARDLVSRGIPMLFLSAGLAGEALPDDLAPVPWIDKPETPDHVVQVLNQLAARTGLQPLIAFRR